MSKILWLSRHQPIEKQADELYRLFGGLVAIDHKDIGNAAEAARVFREGGYDEMVAVVPMSTLHHLCEQGLQPLWPDARPAKRGEAPDYHGAGGKGFVFLGYKRVAKVALKLEEPKPDRAPRGRNRRIAWFARQEPQPTQWAALRHLFGNGVKYVPHPMEYRDARAMGEVYRRSGCNDLMVVAPYGLIGPLCQMRVYPLWSEMDQGNFIRFWRVKGLSVEFTDV